MKTCKSKAGNEQGHVCQEGPFPLGLTLRRKGGCRTGTLGFCRGCCFSPETLAFLPSATTDKNAAAQAQQQGGFVPLHFKFYLENHQISTDVLFQHQKWQGKIPRSSLDLNPQSQLPFCLDKMSEYPPPQHHIWLKSPIYWFTKI